MTTIPARRPVTDGLILMLQKAQLRPVGDGDAQWVDADLPYLVVEQVGTVDTAGDVSHPLGMADVVWQVTAVGRNRQSAEVAMDQARAAILDKDGDGWVNDIDALPTVVFGRWGDGEGGMVIDENVVNVSERFRLSIMPSHLPA